MSSARLLRPALTRSFTTTRTVRAGPTAADFAKRINTPEQDLKEYHKLQRRNAALGLGLALFVGGIWWYSAQAVSAAKDSFTSPQVQQIQQELDREEKLQQRK